MYRCTAAVKHIQTHKATYFQRVKKLLNNK